MSSALVRQALQLVDPEEHSKSRKKKPLRRSGAEQRPQGQGYSYKKQKRAKKVSKCKEEIREDNIKKLLALSTPAADTKIAQKIVERAVKGKPLSDKIEVKVDEQKSILFPDEPFEDFEKSYFCS